ELAPAVPRRRRRLERLDQIRGRRHHARFVVQVEPNFHPLTALETGGFPIARAEPDTRRYPHRGDGGAERVAVQRYLHRRSDLAEHFLRVERQFDVSGGPGPLEDAFEDDVLRALAHDASATPASTPPACSHCARVTSRCVTARNVRGPKANSSTPFSRARATIVAASGASAAT